MTTIRLEQVGGPPLTQSSFELKERVLLGRGSDCQIILPDAVISRRHAQIEARGGKLWMTDLESRAGSFLNDLKLDPSVAVELNLHDRVRIGPWRFRVRSGVVANTYQNSKYGASASSLSGATQYSQPVLAAEARLELLVEYAAASSEAKDLSTLATTTLAFAKRACSADLVSAWQADHTLVQSLPSDIQTEPLLEAFAVASAGGVIRVDQVKAGCAYALVAAIRVDGESLGFLQLEFNQRKPSPEMMEIVHALARFAGVTVAALERRNVESRMARLRTDLEAAHQVQQAIMPKESGTYRAQVAEGGSREQCVNYALHVHPGRVVAGDLVDVFAVNAQKIAFLLGDVSGAGFGAAMLMSAAQAYLHAELMETADAGIAATRCNRYLARMGGGHFVTAWIAILDLPTMQLHIVDAGHGHAQRRLANGSCMPLQLRGSIPLAIDSEANYRAEILKLNPGERMIVYSDGVAEHQNEQGVMFAERIARVLHHSGSCIADRDNLLAALRLHGGGRMPDDDASLLVIG